MSGPVPDPPPPVSRASFSSNRSRSSSQLRTDSRRPSITSNSGTDPYAPGGGSRQQSFSAAGTPLGTGSAGLVFPGPAHGGVRPAYSSRSSNGVGDDDHEAQESLSSPYQPYFPGPPTPRRAPSNEAAQYPLPQSRQPSVDSSASDLPTFTMPFPPPPAASSSSSTCPYARSPSILSPVDPRSTATRPRSHLGPGSTLHKTHSSSSLSGTSSAYSYEAASPSPALPPPGLGPSPNPSTSSAIDAGSGAAGPQTYSVAAGAVGDFARRGEGLGLGRGIMEQQQSVAPDVRSDGYGGGAAGAGALDAAETTLRPRVEQEDLVPTGFDEGVLRALCDMDVRLARVPFSEALIHVLTCCCASQCGMPLLLERMKQSMASCRVRRAPPLADLLPRPH